MSKLKLMRLVASPLYPIAYTLEHATKHPVAIKTALTVLGVAYLTFSMIDPAHAAAGLRTPDDNWIFTYWVVAATPWVLAVFAWLARQQKGSLIMYLSMLAFIGSVQPLVSIALYHYSVSGGTL